MLDLLLLVAVQVQTIKLPPAQAAPPTEVAEIKLAPDLVVRDIRIQDNYTMHVLVANVGTGGVADWFPVRASVELGGRSEELAPSYSEPLAAGAQKWVMFKGPWTLRLTEASSASAGADLYPEPKQSSGGSLWRWPAISVPTSFPGAKAPCRNLQGCVTESDETNNSYAVAGVPSGTPDRLNAPEQAPATVMVPERG